MKLEFHTETDPAAWDAFVAACPAGHFMQSHAWGQFQRQLGWTVHYGSLLDGDALRGAALVLSRRVPGVGSVHYAPRGPAVAYADADARRALLEGLDTHMASQRAIFLRTDPYWTQEETGASPELPAGWRRVPRDWSAWNAPRFVLWLDLSGDEETVFMRSSSRCRNDVRRGYKNDVVFSLGDENDIEDFYRLMVLTGNQKGIAFHGSDFYRDLYRTVNRSAKVQLFLGRLGGELITAGMSVAYGRKSWLLYAASDPAHYKLRANRTLQWEMIKWAHGLGCERYDFRGTATNDPPSPEDPGFGVYEFKKSFGPEFVRLTGYYDLVRAPLAYRALRLMEERGLPLAYRARTWVQERFA